MKILPVLKYALLTVHVALYCYICFIADGVLRLLLAFAGLGSGAMRSLQFALPALLLLTVLAGAALLDRRLSRATGVAELAAKACGAIAAQLLAFGALALAPVLMGLDESWLMPALACAAGAAWFIGRGFFRAHRERPAITDDQNF